MSRSGWYTSVPPCISSGTDDIQDDDLFSSSGANVSSSGASSGANVSSSGASSGANSGEIGFGSGDLYLLNPISKKSHINSTFSDPMGTVNAKMTRRVTPGKTSSGKTLGIVTIILNVKNNSNIFTQTGVNTFSTADNSMAATLSLQLDKSMNMVVKDQQKLLFVLSDNPIGYTADMEDTVKENFKNVKENFQNFFNFGKKKTIEGNAVGFDNSEWDMYNNIYTPPIKHKDGKFIEVDGLGIWNIKSIDIPTPYTQSIGTIVLTQMPFNTNTINTYIFKQISRLTFKCSTFPDNPLTVERKTSNTSYMMIKFQDMVFDDGSTARNRYNVTPYTTNNLFTKLTNIESDFKDSNNTVSGNFTELYTGCMQFILLTSSKVYVTYYQDSDNTFFNTTNTQQIITVTGLVCPYNLTLSISTGLTPLILKSTWESSIPSCLCDSGGCSGAPTSGISGRSGAPTSGISGAPTSGISGRSGAPTPDKFVNSNNNSNLFFYQQNNNYFMQVNNYDGSADIYTVSTVAGKQTLTNKKGDVATYVMFNRRPTLKVVSADGNIKYYTLDDNQIDILDSGLKNFLNGLLYNDGTGYDYNNNYILKTQIVPPTSCPTCTPLIKCDNCNNRKTDPNKYSRRRYYNNYRRNYNKSPSSSCSGDNRIQRRHTYNSNDYWGQPNTPQIGKRRDDNIGYGVGNYLFQTNASLPVPVLNDFSTFGM